MAEAWMNRLCGDLYEVQSAGLEPSQIYPMSIEVMNEVGIDLLQKRTQSVFDVIKKGLLFAYVITVCDESSAAGCPVFPGVTRRQHWSLPDPAAATGTNEDRLEAFRAVRDAIRTKVEVLCREIRTQKP
jgi:arsenate reductase